MATLDINKIDALMSQGEPPKIDARKVDYLMGSAPTPNMTSLSTSEEERRDQNFRVGNDWYQQLYDGQSRWEQMGNMLGRGIGKAALTIPEAVGYLIDIPQLFSESNNFDNALASWVRSQKEGLDENLPEYSRFLPGAEKFNPLSFDWWMRNGDTVIESIGYMFPGMGIARLTAGGLRLLGAGLQAQRWGGAISAGLAMNHVEVMQVAGQTYRDMLEQGYSREEAAAAATDISINGRISAVLEIAQYLPLMRGLAWSRSMNNAGSNWMRRKGGLILAEAGQEAYEEQSLDFVALEAERRQAIATGREVDDGSNMMARFVDYATSDEGLTAGFLGAVGGGLFQSVGSQVGLLADKLEGRKPNQARDIARAQIANNPQQIADILNRNSSLYEQAQEAKANGDMITAEYLEKQAFANLAIQNATAGTYGKFLNTIEALQELTQEEADKYGLDLNEARTKASEMFTEAETIERLYNTNMNKLGDTSPETQSRGLNLLYTAHLAKKTSRKIAANIQKIYTDEQVENVAGNELYNTLQALEALKKGNKNEDFNKFLDKEIAETNKKIQSTYAEEDMYDDKPGKVNISKFSDNLVDDAIQARKETEYFNKFLEQDAREQYKELTSPKGKRAYEEQVASQKQALQEQRKRELKEQIKNATSPEALNELENSTPSDLKPVFDEALKESEEETLAAANPINPDNLEESLTKRYANDNNGLIAASDIKGIRKKFGNKIGIENGQDIIDKLKDGPFSKPLREYFGQKKADEDAKDPTPKDPTPDIKPTDQPIDHDPIGPYDNDTEANRNEDAGALIARQIEFENNNAKFDDEGNLVIAKDDNNTDFDYLNNPEVYLDGVTVEFEVDFNTNPYNKNKKHHNAKDIVITAVYTDANGKHVLGALKSPKKIQDAEGRARLEALREQVWEKAKGKSGVVKTGITTTVSRVHAGRFNIQRGSRRTLEDAFADKDQEIVLGIGIEKSDGDIFIKVPNLKGDSEYNQFSMGKPESGAVYALVKAGNSHIVPLKLYVPRVKELEGLGFTGYNGTALATQIDASITDQVESGKKVSFTTLFNTEITNLISVKMVADNNYEPKVFSVFHYKGNEVVETKVKRENLIEELAPILDESAYQISRNLANAPSATIYHRILRTDLAPGPYTTVAGRVSIDMSFVEVGKQNPKPRKKTPVPKEESMEEGGQLNFLGELPVEDKKTDIDAIVEDIKHNSEFIKLSDDGSSYVNTKTGKTYQRVTSFIDPEDKDGDSPFLKSASIIGTQVDRVVRDFFSGEIDENTTDFSKYTTIDPDADIVVGQGGPKQVSPTPEIQKLLAKLKEVKATMEARNEKVLAEDIVLYNDAIGVAGTVDLLTYDDDGNFRIYDMKTQRGNQLQTTHKSGINKGKRKYDFPYEEGGLSNREKHTRQLNMYRILLNNTHGILAKTVGVMPIVVDYEPGIYTTTRLDLAKGIMLETRDEVLSAKLNQPTEIDDQTTEGDGLDADEGGFPTIRFRYAEEGDYEYMSQNELNELKRMLPEVDTQVWNNLNTVAKYGSMAWGLFKNSTIYLAVGAKTGTAYHEAFHAVFHMYLSPQEKFKLYEAAEKRYGKGARLWLEENMADEFIEYKLAEGRYASKGVIHDFFRDLLNFVKRFLGMESEIDKVFRAINKGNYRYKPTRKVNSQVERYRLMGIDPVTADHSVRFLTTHYWNILANLPDVQGNNEIEILREVGLREVHLRLARLLKGQINKTKNKADKQFLQTLFDNYVISSDNTAAGTVFGPLAGHINNELSNYGIKVSQGLVARDPNSEIYNIEEDQTQFGGWEVKYIEQNGKDNTSFKVKKAIRTLPLVNRQGNPVFDRATKLQTFVNFDELYNFLERNLAGIYDIDEQMEQLKSLATIKPSIKGLIKRLENDEVLQSQFFTNFAKAHADYKLVLNNNRVDYNPDTQEDVLEAVNYGVLSSNRRDLINLVVDEWKYNLDNPNTGIVSKGGEIMTDVAKKRLAKFKELSKEIIAAGEERTESQAKALAKVLQSFGLNVSYSVLMPAVPSAEPGTPRYTKQKRQDVQEFNDFIRNNLSSALTMISNGRKIFEGADKETSTINAVARYISKRSDNLLQSSLRNVDNKQVFSHLIPNSLFQTISNLRKAKDLPIYQKDKLYQYSGLLKDLKETALSQEIDAVLLDGLKLETSTRGVKYVKMSPIEMDLTTVAMYYNQGSNYAYYKHPIFSDKPNIAFIKGHKKTSEQALDQMYDLARMEAARIKRIEAGHTNDLQLYKNEFIYFPILNELGADYVLSSENQDDVREAIRSYMEKELRMELDRLVEERLLSKNEKDQYGFLLKEEGLDSRMFKGRNLIEVMREYLYNTTNFAKQMSFLTNGDTAFYKSNEDIAKRGAQVWSPTLKPNIKATFNGVSVSRTFNMIPIEDSLLTSKHIEEIRTILKDAKISSSTINTITSLFTLSENSEGVNETDGQGYITLNRFRDVMIMYGRWEQRYEDAFDRLQEGRGTTPDMQLFLQPIKPFYFGLHNENGITFPVQIKNSEFVLLPQIANKSPKLRKLLDRMEALEAETGVPSVAQFESTIKVGMRKVNPEDNLETYYEMDNNYFGIQQENPEHFIDFQNIFGTQIRRLIFADIPAGVELDVNFRDEPILSEDAKEMFFDIIEEDLREAYHKVAGRFESIEELQQILLDEVEDRGLPYSFVEALQIKDGEFVIPTWHPFHSYRIQKMLNSIFTNKVVRQKINGAQMVNVSTYGFTDDLNIVWKRDEAGQAYAIDYLEAYMPFWTQKFFSKYTDENGEVDIAKIQDEAPEILNIIGYRIPTEDKYSMFPIRVKGFISAEAGGGIILPSEITTLAGLDYDIDKMQLMIPAVKVTTQGRFKYIRFMDGDTNSEQFLQDVYLSRYGGLLKYREILEKNKVRDEIREGRMVSVFEAFDQLVTEATEIDDLPLTYYEFLEEQGELSAAETIEKIDELISEVPSLEEFIEENKGKSIYQVNSKAARDNAKIELIRSVLNSAEAAGSMVNPGGFDNIIEYAEEYGKTTPVDFFTPRGQMEFFVRTMAGRDLVGILANHNTSHAMFQGKGITLSEGVRFEGETLENLSGITSPINKHRISRSIATALAAILDNSKTPTAGALNFNTHTVNVWALLVRAGVPEKTAFAFISQPIMKRFVNLLVNQNATTDWQISAVANSLLSEVEERITDSDKYYIPRSGVYDFTQERLDEMMTRSSEDWYLVQQAQVLTSFLNYRNTANELTTLINATRTDSVGAGPSISSNEFRLRRIEETYEIGSIVGYEKLFEEKGLIRSFTKYGLEMPNNVMKRQFIEGHDTTRALRELILNKSQGRISEELIQTIAEDFLVFLSTDVDFFREWKPSTYQAILDDVTKIKKTIPAGHPADAFIKNLRVVPVQPNLPLRTLEFVNPGSMSKTEHSLFQDSWEYLMYEGFESDLISNEESRKLAKNLVLYNFINAGFGLTPFNFMNYVPVRFWEEFREYTDVMRKHFAATDDRFATGYIHFADQFLRQSSVHKKYPYLLKTIPKGYSPKVSEGKPTFIKVTRELAEDIEDPKKGLPEYVKLKRGKKTFVMRLDTAAYGGPRYVNVGTLGFEAGLIEYNIREENAVSRLAPNRAPEVQQEFAPAKKATEAKPTEKPVVQPVVDEEVPSGLKPSDIAVMDEYGFAEKIKLEGVDLVYKASPELENVGTKEQYATYLRSIFPNSIEKGIVYHEGKVGQIEEGKPFFTTNDLYWIAELRGLENVGAYKINIQNPARIDKKIGMSSYSVEGETANPNDYMTDETDGVVGRDEGQNENSDTYVTYSPEQVHRLGTQDDIKKFKEFLASYKPEKKTKKLPPLDMEQGGQLNFLDGLEDSEQDC